MKKIYPAIFTETTNKKIPYLIYVPDLDVMTQGTNLDNAIEMAEDIIAFTIIDKENDKLKIPKPSKINTIDIRKSPWHDDNFTGKILNEFKTLITVDPEIYRMKLQNKSVRRNVSLPKWIDEEVNRANINVSALLQESIKQKLAL